MIDSPYGPLSRSDIALLQKASGTEFAWPPTEGSGFPAAAMDVSLYRMEQMQKNSILKDLTKTDLQNLRRVLSAEMLAKMQQAIDERDTKAAQPAQRPEPGTRAADGSVYL